jgi:phosphoribosyl 1,2-cyclic phosphodiesterase
MERPTIFKPVSSASAARFRVLASGSSGNCSVVRAGGAMMLIDAGLSPRRTKRLLAESGLTLDDLDAIILTHLDSDHLHGGWVRALPERTRVFVHACHERAAFLCGVRRENRRLFESSLDVCDGVGITAKLTHHDELGTAAFRFSFEGGGELGFATDLGRTTDGLVEHLRAVDVLAIESNYCPRMQVDSDRPWFLKRRVMGGRGHLSNQECASLVAEVGPRSHVVLLHLSRQCNDPSLVARLHAQRPYRVTITSQFAPTPWIEIAASGGGERAAPAQRPIVMGSLFDHIFEREGTPESAR